MRSKNRNLESEPVYKTALVHRMLLAIFAAKWKAGERLREVDVAERFGVSRTPVREAFQEIAGIGLIELKPNCGAVVAPFGLRELKEIYEVRALLEGEAARLAVRRLGESEVDELAEESRRLLAATRHDREWSAGAWRTDRRLHGLIAERCGNKRLAREIARYANFIQIIRETLANRDRVQDMAIQQHLDILAAVAKGDANRAAEMMRRHVSSAGNAAMDALKPIFATQSSSLSAQREKAAA